MKINSRILIVVALAVLSIVTVSFAAAQAGPAAAPHVTLNSITVWVNQTRMTVHDGDTIDVNIHDIVVVQPKATYYGRAGSWGSLEVDSIPSDLTVVGTAQIKMLKPGVATSMQLNTPLYTGPSANDYSDFVSVYGGIPGSQGTLLAQIVVNVRVPE